MKFVSRFITAAFVTVLFSATPANAGTIVLGHIDHSSSEATAIVIQTMLERMGFNVAVKKGLPSVMYPILAEGGIDLFVAARLPNDHAPYWEEYKDELVLVTPLYEDARLFWAVPDYVPASAVRSIADLANSDVVSRMNKVIRGPEADSPLMIRSESVMKAYGLSQAGYQLAPGKTADWVARFNASVKAEKWFVMPLWQPHYLNMTAKLRILDEPKILLGEPDTAWLIAHKDAKRKIGEMAFGVLEKMELSLKAVNEIDYRMNVAKLSAHDAARSWMGAHFHIIEYWLDPEYED